MTARLTLLKFGLAASDIKAMMGSNDNSMASYRIFVDGFHVQDIEMNGTPTERDIWNWSIKNGLYHSGGVKFVKTVS